MSILQPAQQPLSLLVHRCFACSCEDSSLSSTSLLLKLARPNSPRTAHLASVPCKSWVHLLRPRNERLDGAEGNISDEGGSGAVRNRSSRPFALPLRWMPRERAEQQRVLYRASRPTLAKNMLDHRSPGTANLTTSSCPAHRTRQCQKSTSASCTHLNEPTLLHS
jgi:hypothetical protein